MAGPNPATGEQMPSGPAPADPMTAPVPKATPDSDTQGTTDPLYPNLQPGSGSGHDVSPGKPFTLR